MNSDEIKNAENLSMRRKFVWGAGVLSMMTLVAGVLKVPFLIKKNIITGKPQSKTVRMLTQDGRLVEIDESLITTDRKKITDTEMQNWIKK